MFSEEIQHMTIYQKQITRNKGAQPGSSHDFKKNHSHTENWCPFNIGIYYNRYI